MAHDREQHPADDTTDVHDIAAADAPASAAQEDASEQPDGDVDSMLTAIERELTSLVTRCEETTARHAEELTQRQAEIDRTLQIALKRQVEIDRQTEGLKKLADEVVQAEHSLRQRRKSLALKLRHRRSQLSEKMTAAVDAHAERAAQELEARAKELAQREAECARSAEQTQQRMASAESDLEHAQEVRALVEQQASLTAEHARDMDEVLAKREQASLELVERLTDACDLADRVRELKGQLREYRGESRELLERVERAEGGRVDAQSALDAARARIAQLESQVQSLSRDKLLVEQRSLRVEAELDLRESHLTSREQAIELESQRLADDQAACDHKIRELGDKLAAGDRLERERALDPRTPLPECSWPLPVSPRRRPELRLVPWKGSTS
ncbi:MAG: hypothetical protein ACFCBV_12710 [Phycisphaerales bacterium]